jgi:hypothetical protein
MIVIGQVIISEDLKDEFFACNLQACQGACCVQGDKGAPLESFEAKILSDQYDVIRPFLQSNGVLAIKEQGHYTLDVDGTLRTPLASEGPCAYAIFEKGIAKCGIEKAYEARHTEFRKPISCHLYPVRIKKYTTSETINYHQWDICQAACRLGKELKIPVYRFAKDALIRNYGEEFFEALEAALEATD